VRKLSKQTRYADVFFQLTRRHLLVFFKNKIRVMYTLLVPVIIFAVYVLFLRDMELLTVENTLLKMGIEADETLYKHVCTLVDSWMLSGITALSTITVALQTNSVFVEDKQNGVNRDFASSPIHRNVLIGSYFLFNFLVTAAICFVFLLICALYLGLMGEFVLTFSNVLTIFAVLLFTTVVSTLMTIFICTFVKTEATMASIVAVFSTAMGFLIGAYMPLGMLPHWVQNFCAFIPGTYSCSLLRYSFMETPLNLLSDHVINVMQIENGAELIAELSGSFGYQLNFFGLTVNPQFQSLALGVFLIIFLVLNIVSGKKLADVLGGAKKKIRFKKKSAK
jgi:multidrug/hemolysin transport system permease protein